MDRKPARLLRAAEIADPHEWYSQRLNPRSRLGGTPLATLAGFNRSNADLVYLEGGERRGVDVIEYPPVGKRFLLLHEGTRGISFYKLGEAVHPFGRVEPPRPAR